MQLCDAALQLSVFIVQLAACSFGSLAVYSFKAAWCSLWGRSLQLEEPSPQLQLYQ